MLERAAWCFGPSVKAFKHYHSILSVDCTFLMGKFKGVLLVAPSCDANDQLTPIAFALVEKKDSNNWLCFVPFVRTRIVLDKKCHIGSSPGNYKCYEG